MKSKLLFLNIFCLLFVFNVALAESLDISFVDKLRYSNESFLAGENIRIYSTLQNNSGFDLRGTIRFYDNEKFIGDFDFFVSNQKSIEAWVDWFSNEGGHNFKTKIYDVKKLEIAKEPVTVSLDNEIIISEKLEVDIDTDKDGIANKKDLDDDNDGILDTEEIKLGTDPLVFNEPVKNNSIQENESNKSKTSSVENSEGKTTIIENLFENVKNITDATLIKSRELTGETATFLEKQKEAIDEEIDKDKKIELVQKELQESSSGGEEVNYYTASIIDAVPNLKEIYSFILGVLIFIFNTWWVLLGVIFFVLWMVWKVVRNKMELRRF